MSPAGLGRREWHPAAEEWQLFVFGSCSAAARQRFGVYSTTLRVTSMLPRVALE